MFSNTFFTVLTVALAGLNVASATPVTPTFDAVKCYFIVTPSPNLGPEALQTSINYAVGRKTGGSWPNTILQTDNKIFEHNDGTYDLESIIEVDGVGAADIITFVESWDEETIDGLQAQWKVNAVNCYDQA
ncbi:hypothetical protein BDV98DRAFT_569822 [Pterulicium gracile]|uniref:Uncharacterized protein n=1 Tax=Pterulicium gracile TaxID=1884261 RepID=A0A5C3QHN5_9AGAR|nr:hypothetical protein BDV98DRAFT_569822 [Pterula gracilis]